MSDQAVTPRFAIEYRAGVSSSVVSSATYNEPSEALQAYRDATEAFRAAKLPAGASLSLNDQKLEFHAGAVSEGLGVVRHSWLKEPARERFDALQVSAQERPEQAALRAAFAGVARDAERSGAPGGTIEFTERIASKDPGRTDANSDRVGGPEDEARTDSLRKRYLRTPDGYHDKQTMELVIADKGSKLVTQREDTATVDAMAIAASDRGWSAVTLSGTEAFRREAWYQLSARGIEVTGYSPTQADKARLAEVQRAQDQEQRQGQERKEKAAPVKAAAEPSVRSPVEEASKAVRQMAPDIAIEGSTTPREQLAVSAAANQAYGAAVAANDKARNQAQEAGQGKGITAPARVAPARPVERPLTTDQQVMVAAVDRALRDGGLSAEQRERVREVATKVAVQNPEVKAPRVADRAAIPQPVASPAPQKQARRDLSR